MLFTHVYIFCLGRHFGLFLDIHVDNKKIFPIYFVWAEKCISREFIFLWSNITTNSKSIRAPFGNRLFLRFMQTETLCIVAFFKLSAQSIQFLSF